MVAPETALSVFGLLLLSLMALFWPVKGLFPRIMERLGRSERVQLEDSLKHLYKCEYAGKPCSVDSVAGSVGVNRTRALELLAQLAEMQLAQASGDGVQLTEAGREYALHIVRTHRLLERYLADRTGIHPLDWHQEAERQEHAFSPEDTHTLAARLGHPLYDPHGDPIPTARGDLPPLKGLPLTALATGEVASVVHLGDEPREVFQALSEVGLSPQMRVRVLAKDGGEVRFEAGGKQHVLPSLLARNVTVEPLPDAEVEEGEKETLAEIGLGETIRVAGIHPAFQGPQRRRLLDLGFVPGTRVAAEFRSASGDPIAYRVRGALIALRKDQARWILVNRTGEAVEA